MTWSSGEDTVAVWPHADHRAWPQSLTTEPEAHTLPTLANNIHADLWLADITVAVVNDIGV